MIKRDSHSIPPRNIFYNWNYLEVSTPLVNLYYGLNSESFSHHITNKLSYIWQKTEDIKWKISKMPLVMIVCLSVNRPWRECWSKWKLGSQWMKKTSPLRWLFLQSHHSTQVKCHQATCHMRHQVSEGVGRLQGTMHVITPLASIPRFCHSYKPADMFLVIIQCTYNIFNIVN